MNSSLHNPEMTTTWFTEARYGLNSLLKRGDWNLHGPKVPNSHYDPCSSDIAHWKSQS
jgi:hypothetical protein